MDFEKEAAKVQVARMREQYAIQFNGSTDMADIHRRERELLATALRAAFDAGAHVAANLAECPKCSASSARAGGGK